MPLQFTWDRAKADANLEMHGLSFEEASTAFSDPLSITVPDPDHSEGEARFVLIGQTFRGNLVVVVHSEREGGIKDNQRQGGNSA